MLSDVRDHFGLTRGISLISQVAYFETTQLQKLVAELKLAINDSKLIVLAGMVGTGKTATLEKIQDRLEQSKDILVASSLSVDGTADLTGIAGALVLDATGAVTQPGGPLTVAQLGGSGGSVSLLNTANTIGTLG